MMFLRNLSPRAVGHGPPPLFISEEETQTTAVVVQQSESKPNRTPSTSKLARGFAPWSKSDDGQVLAPGESNPHGTRALGASAAIAGFLWVMCSSSIILLNKKVLSHYNFTAVNTLLAYHCIIAVVLLRLTQLFGFVEIVPLTREVLVMWFPLNCIFVGMLATAFKSLGLVSGLHARVGWRVARVRTGWLLRLLSVLLAPNASERILLCAHV